MTVEMFESLPEYAQEIRQKVFIQEQGFQEEFDEIDYVAVHFVVFDDSKQPIGTCRVFWNAERNSYILGRLAVLKEARRQNAGRTIMEAAEGYVRKMGGRELQLHAQSRITAFYSRLGFVAFGEEDEEEGCPHIWMKKYIPD